MEGYSVDALQVGQSASFSKTITEHDVYTFAGVTGDLNPAHINERYARETQFHGRIAHGMLSAGVVSAVIVIKQKICPGGCSGTEQQNAGRRYFSFFAGDYGTNRIIVVMTGNFGAGAEFEEKGVSVTVFGLLSQT